MIRNPKPRDRSERTKKNNRASSSLSMRGSLSGELLPLVRVAIGEERQAASKFRSRSHDLTPVWERAAQIVRDVRTGGDDALLRYSRELDGAQATAVEGHIISKAQMAVAARRVRPQLLEAMRTALRRIQRTQGRLLERLAYSYVADGFVIRSAIRPLESIGCYIPGGRASYASTVLMTAGVAKLAGVGRVVVSTPPPISDAILAAAWLCGVDAVYGVGGAHSIAAMAYGTETIQSVSKIVGPGGIYVSAAKKIVSSDAQIDFFAGPTELIVLGDRSVDPKMVAWDVMGQAEHGEDSICGVVTWDERFALEVKEFIAATVPELERRNYVEGCLRRGFVALCSSRASALELVNSLAPEHLELMLAPQSEAAEMTRSVRNAGLILSGPYAACAASDYCIGTDHVIPTEGGARFRAGLTALDFVKLNWTVEGSKRGLRALLPTLKEMAFAEGLPNHYRSVEARFKK